MTIILTVSAVSLTVTLTFRFHRRRKRSLKGNVTLRLGNRPQANLLKYTPYYSLFGKQQRGGTQGTGIRCST